VKPRALLVLALACSPSPPPAAHITLSGDAVAVVGDVKISRDLVARVAAAQHLSTRQALGSLTDDAIASQSARQRGLDHDPNVAWQSTAALGRVAADRIAANARAKGPPTDAELAVVTARRWREFDLPEHVRVVHAIVMKKKGTDPKIAATVADALLAAVRTTPDANTFESAAKAVDGRGNELRVEQLPTFTEDGRIVEQEGNMDPTFAATSFALAHVGDTSTVLETSFGWHVIRLLERLPAHRVPTEERRVALADLSLKLRARSMYEATLARLAGGEQRVIDPAAEGLMASVSVP